MEKKIFKYGSYAYKYYLEYSKRKSFSLVVFPNSKIVLKSPLEASERVIEDFLVRKWIWLKKQLNELERYQKMSIEREFVSGENFYYLGRQYMLRVVHGNQDSVKVSPGIINLSTTKKLTNIEYNKMLYGQWYLKRCESIFKRELLQALKDYDIKIIPKLKVREMKTRWGSYYNNTVNVNPKLLQASKAAIRYVITHELCHIVYKNHDKQFYALLETRMPDWKRIKEELEVRFG